MRQIDYNVIVKAIEDLNEEEKQINEWTLQIRTSYDTHLKADVFFNGLFVYSIYNSKKICNDNSDNLMKFLKKQLCTRLKIYISRLDGPFF